MSLISASQIEENIIARRCLTCATTLQLDDYICCKQQMCFGKLLNGVMSSQTERIVTYINEGLINDHYAVKNFSESTKNSIKSFFSKIISVEASLQESYIHYFLYLFWDDLNIKILDKNKNSKIWFTSQSKKRPISGSDTESALVRHLASQIETDLVYINKQNETLYFVEVKRDTLCDRGVGQLYRYYDFISKQLPATLFRQLNINYVKPIIILKNISSGQWKSFTSHFLENILVYEFEVPKQDDSVVLHDRKAQVLGLFYRSS